MVSSGFLTKVEQSEPPVEESSPQVEQAKPIVQVARFPALVLDLPGVLTTPQDQAVNPPDAAAEAKVVVVNQGTEPLCSPVEVLAATPENRNAAVEEMNAPGQGAGMPPKEIISPAHAETLSSKLEFWKN